MAAHGNWTSLDDSEFGTGTSKELDVSLPIEEEDVDSNERQSEQLSSLPPLVLISSMVKRFMSLVKLANPGVAVIYYNYQSTTLSRMLQYIRDRLRGRKAYSICFVAHGRPGNFKLTSGKNVTLTSILEDKELREFFTDLVSTYLHNESDLARIDILNCPIETNADGKQLIQTISKLIGVPVYTSKDIWGAELLFPSSANGEADSSIKIGTLYFDGQRLKDWCGADNEMKLDKYEKIRTVGQGAYGQAVLYRRKDDDSKVILKKINLLELRKEERQGVLTEIKILSMLDHPHIVSYYDSFEENGVMMIEMEYAEGGSLQQYLKAQASPLTELDILTKFSQMVDAIRYVHMHNILHRDLKTANIFLTRIGFVKLGDFGIAKVLSATHQAAHTMVGTPYYISPEICEGKRYDAKSDVWSLGCILYEMLCLQKTFEGTNLPALVHKIVEGSFEPIKGQYTEELKQLVRQMLQKNPINRPSADQLHTKFVPILLKPIQEKEGVLQSRIDIAPSDDENTRSFLYYLDGSTLLLKPVVNPFTERIRNVAVGYSHIVAVTVDLNVYSWGDNGHGQLGHGDTQTRTQPVLIESLNEKNIKSAQCGGEFSIFMNENGIVMSCGRGNRGMLGHGNTRDSSKPEMIRELLSHDVNVIECGESHVVMLTMDGRIFVWGSGDCGRLGTGSGDDCLKPTEITVRSPGTKMDETVSDIRCGIDCSVFITDVGRLFACGNNTDNKLGLNGRETFLMHMKKLVRKKQLEVPCTSVPTPIKELGKHRIVDCFMGVTHSVFLTESGLVYTFGRNSEAQLGGGHCSATDMPNIVKGLKPMIVKSMELATIVTSESNSFYLWGSRPVVRSPLKPILSGDSNNDIPNHQITSSPDSGFKESPSSTPKLSSEEVNSNTPKMFKTKISKIELIKEPMETATDTAQSSPIIRHKSTLETLLADVPHEQVPCAISTKYSTVVTDTSNQMLTNATTGNNKIIRQTSIQSTLNQKNLKKGSRGSLDKVNVTSEGKILSPVSIDLVEESGISNSLWSQGLENIKLEDIACFGSNLVVLIYASLSNKGTPAVNKRKDSFVVGRNLSFRRKSITTTLTSHQFNDGVYNNNINGRPETLPEESSDDNEDDRKVYSKANRPMSPTAELPTWLRGDLEEGIPQPGSQSSPPPNKPAIDESHGWFPNSMKLNVVMAPVEGTMLKRNNSEKKKLHTRRPSGAEIGSTNNDNLVPILTSSDHVTGIKRLPSTTKSIRNEEPATKENATKVKNYQPTTVRLVQAKSIANLPVKSTAANSVKRILSSNNIAKTANKSGQPSKSSLVDNSQESRRGKLQRSSTTPAKIFDDDNEPVLATGNSRDNVSSKKIKIPSSGSPYMQPLTKKVNLTKIKTSKENGKRMEVPEPTTGVLHNELELRKKFEEEREELQRVIEEKSRDAEENDKHLKAQIEKLNERLEKMEAEKQDFSEFKEKLSRLEKEQSEAKAQKETESNTRRNPLSKFCVTM